MPGKCKNYEGNRTEKRVNDVKKNPQNTNKNKQKPKKQPMLRDTENNLVVDRGGAWGRCNRWRGSKGTDVQLQETRDLPPYWDIRHSTVATVDSIVVHIWKLWRVCTLRILAESKRKADCDCVCWKVLTRLAVSSFHNVHTQRIMLYTRNCLNVRWQLYLK